MSLSKCGYLDGNTCSESIWVELDGNALRLVSCLLELILVEVVDVQTLASSSQNLLLLLSLCFLLSSSPLLVSLGGEGGGISTAANTVHLCA